MGDSKVKAKLTSVMATTIKGTSKMELSMVKGRWSTNMLRCLVFTNRKLCTKASGSMGESMGKVK